ncbi:MAG: protein-L-isoaspartate(D-aspartate) O-methyltransferase [Rhodospirillales bacterium]
MISTRTIRMLLDLRGAGICDTRVLSAIERVPREEFLPPPFQHQACENVALPIGHGQTVSQPTVVARMTQALELTDRHKVLEIGTGSGYQTAVLARLARRVYTIERHRPLLAEAERRLESLRLRNVTTRAGDGSKGWPEQAPFDRIIVTCAAPFPPHPLAAQLGTGGVMMIPVGEQKRDQRIMRIRRMDDGFHVEDLWTVRFVPLVAAAPPREAFA